MDNKLVQRLQQILANQAQRGLLGTRFKIEKFPEQDIAEMLRMCYQSEVERRNMKYVSDEATLEKRLSSFAETESSACFCMVR